MDKNTETLNNSMGEPTVVSKSEGEVPANQNHHLNTDLRWLLRLFAVADLDFQSKLSLMKERFLAFCIDRNAKDAIRQSIQVEKGTIIFHKKHLKF